MSLICSTCNNNPISCINISLRNDKVDFCSFCGHHKTCDLVTAIIRTENIHCTCHSYRISKMIYKFPETSILIDMLSSQEELKDIEHKDIIIEYVAKSFGNMTRDEMGLHLGVDIALYDIVIPGIKRVWIFGPGVAPDLDVETLLPIVKKALKNCADLKEEEQEKG